MFQKLMMAKISIDAGQVAS